MPNTFRHKSPYSKKEKFLRLLWGCVQSTLFRWSPRPLWPFRNALLRLFQAQIGNNVRIYNSARISYPWLLSVGDETSIGDEVIVYNLGRITIGQRVTLSQRSHLCAGTHDYSNIDMALIRSSITINNDAWICTEAFVGPGVIVGEGTIVAARAVVVKNVLPWTIVAGNPAQLVKERPRFHDQ